MDLGLGKSSLVDARVSNWNKINAHICFYYLQQQFYMLAPTLKSLAAGKKEGPILMVLKKLVNSIQGTQFETYLDDESIRDIAEVVEADGDLFNEEEKKEMEMTHATQDMTSKKYVKVGQADDE